MEVHKHPHHLTHKKKWSEYLLEFVMLFLAVFLGFTAENLREHKVERHREKDYVSSMISDLKTDTLHISENIRVRVQKRQMIDSLLEYLKAPDPNAYGTFIYFFGRRLTRATRFQSNDRTIQQLKSSGSMRLIKSQKASDAIMAYTLGVERIYYGQEREDQELYQVSSLLKKLLDGNVLETMIKGRDIILPEGNPPLRTTNRDIILDLTYDIHQMKTSLILNILRMREMLQIASNTLEMLQKEYHLENE
ncbi:MAG TPA: hypothetical protein VMY77_08195 [Chitinophagaceae bacterium]|nr:hypothetical protein [Chitinophagaceae bacterium]